MLPTAHRLLLRLLLLGVAAAILGAVLAHGRHELALKRVHAVVPGLIYRGAAQEALPYERLVEGRGIRTILTLLDDNPNGRREQVEADLASRRGVELVRVGMPGTGLGDYDDLERAAAVLADESKHPVFVHCAAGVHRTGGVVAIYRMRYLGWSFEQAMEEMDRRGAKLGEDDQLLSHMRGYYEQRMGGR